MTHTVKNLVLIILLLTPIEVFAHSGRTDSYGGHNKTSNGTYHCHSGECLKDAKRKAYKIAFPIGEEDGRNKNTDGFGEYSDILWGRYKNGEIDSDVAEYMIPYALEAYKAGFDSTYVPTFWEKYRDSLITPIAITLIIGIYGTWTLIDKVKKRN